MVVLVSAAGVEEVVELLEVHTHAGVDELAVDVVTTAGLLVLEVVEAAAAGVGYPERCQ